MGSPSLSVRMATRKQLPSLPPGWPTSKPNSGTYLEHSSGPHCPADAAGVAQGPSRLVSSGEVGLTEESSVGTSSSGGTEGADGSGGVLPEHG